MPLFCRQETNISRGSLCSRLLLIFFHATHSSQCINMYLNYLLSFCVRFFRCATHTHTHAHVCTLLTRTSTRLCRKMHELYILYTPPTPPFLTPKNGAKTEKFLWADDHGTFSKSILPPPWDPPRGPKRGVLGGVGVLHTPPGGIPCTEFSHEKK